MSSLFFRHHPLRPVDIIRLTIDGVSVTVQTLLTTGELN
jgi:hypothetical protein